LLQEADDIRLRYMDRNANLSNVNLSEKIIVRTENGFIVLEGLPSERDRKTEFSSHNNHTRLDIE
jgi:hypothetical protein